MICLYCGGEMAVINSRAQKRNNQVWRRRQCQACRAVFTTHEAIDLSSALIVDYGASERPFSQDHLFTELLLALQDRRNYYRDARELTSTVVQELLKLPSLPHVKSKAISRAAAKVLKRLDRRAWLRYIAEHESLQAKPKLT